jgi:hypothetical protein
MSIAWAGDIEKSAAPPGTLGPSVITFGDPVEHDADVRDRECVFNGVGWRWSSTRPVPVAMVGARFDRPGVKSSYRNGDPADRPKLKDERMARARPSKVEPGATERVAVRRPFEWRVPLMPVLSSSSSESYPREPAGRASARLHRTMSDALTNTTGMRRTSEVNRFGLRRSGLQGPSPTAAFGYEAYGLAPCQVFTNCATARSKTSLCRGEHRATAGRVRAQPRPAVESLVRSA